MNMSILGSISGLRGEVPRRSRNCSSGGLGQPKLEIGLASHGASVVCASGSKTKARMTRLSPRRMQQQPRIACSGPYGRERAGLSDLQPAGHRCFDPFGLLQREQAAEKGVLPSRCTFSA